MGRRNARVRICQDPLLGGIGEATKSVRIAEIVKRYDGMTDVFVLCVDRDGNRGRRRRLDDIEVEFGDRGGFLAENAWEELETWVLAGLALPDSWRWADIRAEVHVKEEYFEKLASAAVWPMVRAAAVELWAKKPRCESTRSGKSVQRISMFSPSASKPSYRETERGHRGTTLCFVIVWRCRGPACTRANFRSPASAAISTMSLRKRNGDYSERWRKSLGGLRFCHSIRKHWKAAKLK